MTDLHLYFCGGCGTVHSTPDKPPTYECYVCGEIHWHEFTMEPDDYDEMYEEENNNKVDFYHGRERRGIKKAES